VLAGYAGAQETGAIGRVKSSDKSALLRVKPSEKSSGQDISGYMFIIDSCPSSWCKVRVPFKDKQLLGWVRLDAIDIVAPATGKAARRSADLFPPVPNTTCDALTDQPILNVNLNRFKCSEGILSEGFERCTAEVLYDVQFYCDPPPGFSMSLRCELAYDYDVQEGSGVFPSRGTADERKSIYPLGRFDSGGMDIDVRLRSIFSPVVRVKPRDLSCRISQF